MIRHAAVVAMAALVTGAAWSQDLDLTPPAAVTLAVTATSADTVTLQWTAPGDDGNTGTAAQYEVRYSSAGPINSETAWLAATPVTGEPAPQPAAGTVQTMTVSGLLTGTTYWFALKTADERPNWSGLSNSPSGTTGWYTSLATAFADGAGWAFSAATQGVQWAVDATPSSMPGGIARAGNSLNYNNGTNYESNVLANAGDATSPLIDISGMANPRLRFWCNYQTETAGTAKDKRWVKVGNNLFTTVHLAQQVSGTAGCSASGTWHRHTFALTPSWGQVRVRFTFDTVDGLNNAYDGWAVDDLEIDPDVPAAVTDLGASVVTGNSITMQWTSPGDDANTGTASAYDLRRSTAPITSETFGQSTPVPGEPAPAAAGTAQSVTITDLAPNTTYYFALKTQDDAGTWSALSNAPAVTTLDTVAPAAVTNLSVTSFNESSVTLQWTAPGDDGTTGTASQFDVRYSTTGPITAANFASAAEATGEPVPGASGTTQQFAVTGLASDVTYWFAVKTGDEVPNWSGTSNSPSQKTKDVIPPGTPSVSVTGVTWTTVALQWASVGDNGSVGNSYAHQVRRSSAPIVTSTDYFNATLVANLVSAPVGTTMTYTITGLTPGTTYYVAVRAYDEASNWGGVSNSPAATTHEQNPPAAITNLSIGVVNGSAVALYWTAPGDDGATGTAAGYDLRYSSSPITESSFTSCLAIPGVPTPQPAGTAQTMTVTMADGTWYFAIKTRDEVPNWSSVSNSPMAAVPDAVAPATISDLAVTAVTATTVTLQWTAPGDEGSLGTATSFEVRYWTDGSSWSSGTTVPNPPAPGAPGTTQVLVVQGLDAGTTYWFGVRTADEVQNWSAVSNTPSATTQGHPHLGTGFEDGAPGWTFSGMWGVDGTPASMTGGAAHTGANSLNFNNGVDYFIAWTAHSGTATSPAINVSKTGYVRFWCNYHTETTGTYADRRTVQISSDNFQTFHVNQQLAGMSYYQQPPYLCAAMGAWHEHAIPVDGTWGNVKVRFIFDTYNAYYNHFPGWFIDDFAYDRQAPGTVADLVATAPTSTSVTLQWTAPGDDGSTGTASSYEVRCSTSPIVTEADFAAATPVNGIPAPAAAGTSQSFIVGQLFAGTAHYFALRAIDDEGQAAGISNVASATTSAGSPDAIAPVAVGTLVVKASWATAVDLGWTAPGDDGIAGFASAYDIRYATSPITSEGAFAAASPVVGEPQPAAPGKTNRFRVGGLLPGTTYWFALKAVDEAGNASGVSNSVTATTPSGPATCNGRAVTTVSTLSQSASWRSVDGTLSADDARGYVLVAVTPGTWIFSTCAAEGGAAAFDSFIGVFDAAGALIASNDDHCGVASRVDVSLGTGTFYVVVSGNGTASGAYTLSYRGPSTGSAPAAVTDLSVYSTVGGVTLMWTAPAGGTAVAYDIRYYPMSPISDEQTWLWANQASGEPIPAEPGTVQIFTLQSGYPWYFAVRSIDAAGNLSPLGNSIEAQSTGGGGTPEGVTNLAPVGVLNSSAVVRWTAVHGFGSEGAPVSYKFVISTTPITNDDEFDAATEIAAPYPGIPGSAMDLELTGLAPSTTYYLAVKAFNGSFFGPLSDAASVTTTP